MKDEKFVPLIFAGDINVYSLCRAFDEAYGIKPYVFGKYNAMPCQGSKIMHYTANPKVDEQEEFMKIVNEFAAAHSDEKIIILGCGDNYIRRICVNKDNLPKNCIAPYIDIDLMDRLINKERFYELCDTVGIWYPATFVHKKEMGNYFELPFNGPYIVKPSNSIPYWEHPFDGMKKVFKLKTMSEIHSVLNAIYASGYDDSVIIQNCIPGDDTYMRVLTTYSDRNGKVKMMCLGHVLLEEHTPHGLGNHAVIITESEPKLEARFKKLLEDMHYVGFANFDIKYDKRDGKFKAFELNARQGRSNYYVTNAGANVAELLVKDRIFEEELEENFVDNESLWMVVPHGVAYRNVRQQEYKKRMRKLIKAGKCVNPLLYKKDDDFKRKLKLWKNQLGHYYKFAKYYKPEE